MVSISPMTFEFPLQKFLHQSEKYFSEKIDISLFSLYVRENEQLADIFSSEIQSAIDLFNENRKNFDSEKEFNIYQNAVELNTVFRNDLPKYSEIINTLFANQEIVDKVFRKLKTSPYFVDVWRLGDSEKLLANLMILLYRTTLLHLKKDTLVDNDSGENLVQISSTVEEMIYFMKLSGKNTRLFESVSHWLVSWEEEGFSEELYNKVKTHLQTISQ